MATTPKKGVCACPRLSMNIKNEPENIPIIDPITPNIVSKVLDTILVLFMFNHMFYILYINL